jgi:hypothetical protein
MYDFAFRIQVIILEFRKNLRYWVLALPIITLIAFPLMIGLTSFVYSFAVNKTQGVLAVIPQDKSKVKLKVDLENHVDLKNGRRLFFSRVNSRDNTTFGFRKLYYTIKFFDKGGKEVDTDSTRYENFVLPAEVFYLTHFASNNAETMKVEFLNAESDLVNILPEDTKKYQKQVAALTNLKADIGSDDFFNLNFALNNTSGKKLQNLRYQYVVTNKASELVYVGNLTISELTEVDKDIKSVSSLSYPLNVPKGELTYVTDNNVIRYNFFEYEK